MKSVKWTTITGILLCLPCCLLPILGLTVGGAAFGSFLGHMEKLGMVLLLISIMLLANRYLYKQKTRKSCDPGCSCKSTAKTGN